MNPFIWLTQDGNTLYVRPENIKSIFREGRGSRVYHSASPGGFQADQSPMEVCHRIKDFYNRGGAISRFMEWLLG